MSANPTGPHPLYSLLPAIFRTRDLAEAGSLQALFDVLGSQSDLLEENIRQLYDDQFIETCAPWAIPYIGALIGFDPIYTAALDGQGSSQDSRAEVADIIGYRRRKGTLLALEQVSTDVSGRTVLAIEEFRRVITTLSLRNVRPRHASTVDLRFPLALSSLGGPFETLSHTIDLRRIAPREHAAQSPDATPLESALHGGGRYHVPDVALWIWRWRSFPITGAPAFSLGGGRYLFNPLGAEMPLFQQPPGRTPFDRLSTPLDVPQPIARQDFARRPADFYPASVQLILDGTPIPVSQIHPADLSCDGATIPFGKIAIDPQTGRIQLASNLPRPSALRVDYSFGFPGEIGGGPYDRSSRLPAPLPGTAVWTAVVGSSEYPSLQAAVHAWNAQPAGLSGRILLSGFISLQEDLTGPSAIRLAPGSNLLMASASFAPGDPTPLWTNAWATLTGRLEIVGLPAAPHRNGDAAPLAQCKLSGLRLAGQVLVSGHAVSVQVEDSTLVPGLGLTRCGHPLTPGEPSVIGTAPGSCFCLNRAITGPLAADSSSSVRIIASIVDAGSPCCPALAAPDLVSSGATLHIEDSTVIGKVHVQAIQLASNTLFHARTHLHDGWKAAVWCTRRQTGCVRFSWLPWNSLTPRRYLCLPDNAAHQGLLEPQFISLRYGHPGYCLLSGDVPLALWKGADNGSQIGVWNEIAEAEAIRNVQLRSEEYLPATQEAGIFLVPSRSTRLVQPPLPYGYPPPRCGGCADDSDQVPIGIGIGLI